MEGEKGKKLAEEVMRMVNSMGDTEDKKAFVLGIYQSHNTLQQGFIRELIMPLLKMMGESTWVDARNQAAHDFAKWVIDNLPEDKSYFPFI
jgi:hypothetical protein